MRSKIITEQQNTEDNTNIFQEYMLFDHAGIANKRKAAPVSLGPSSILDFRKA